MARILIDTHVWLWSLAEPERLSETARTVLTDADHELLVSVASVAEIGIKHSIGKLSLPEPVGQFISRRIAADDLTVLALELSHVLALAELPLHHRDPFDRMLIAQARVEGVPLMTSDPWFEPYGLELIPAS